MGMGRAGEAQSVERFWETKSLGQMSRQEWESLCDGCGRCCLLKLKDQDTGEVAYVGVSCHLLDLSTCRCGDYHNRAQLVPDCVVLGMDTYHYHRGLPTTCAYRRLANGDPLCAWHPLVSGSPETVGTVAILQGGVETVRQGARHGA